MANELLKGIAKIALAIVGLGAATEVGKKGKEDYNNYKKLNQNNNAQ